MSFSKEGKTMPVLSAFLSHNPACPVREIGDGLVIMAPQGDTTHSLEGLGAFIWKEFDGTKDLATVLDNILANYEVDRATAEADLIQFTEEMIAADLLISS